MNVLLLLGDKNKLYQMQRRTKLEKNTKWILKKIKIDGESQDVIAQSTDEHVSVIYNGKEMTLAKALDILKEDTQKIPNITTEQIKKWDSVTNIITDEIKENPTSGDFVFVIDMSDGGKIKKFPFPPGGNPGGIGEYLNFATDSEIRDIFEI